MQHHLKTEANNYSGTLIQRDERSKHIYICHECWKAFDIRNKKFKKVLVKGKIKMEQSNYFIRANVFGKIKYWEFIHGLHSGKGKGGQGFSMFPSVKAANQEITKLKKVFHGGIVWDVLPHDELPFIKKQILARKKNKRICIYCKTSNNIKRKFCKKCRKYQR